MPHSLLAVILVATQQGKHQIVFAYPPHPAALPRTSRPTYGKSFAMAHRTELEDEEDEVEETRRGYGAPVPHAEDDTPEGQNTPPTFGENSWLIKDKRRDPHAEPVHEYLGIDAEVLADALLPNHTQLYNEKFELVINHLAFIGHPVLLDSMRKKQKESSFSPTTSTSTYALDQSVATLDSYTFPAASPISPAEDPSLSRSVSLKTRNVQEEERVAKLDRFNFVLVIDTPPDKDLSRQLDMYYRDIIVKITAAFKGEERSNNWLSQEAMRCRKTRAEFRPDQIDTMTNRLVSTSPLCSAIVDIYEAVVNNKAAHLSDLNGSLDMSLLLHDELLDGKPLDGYRDVGTVDVVDPSLPLVSDLSLPPAVDGAPRLARWHALLPLEEPATMLEELETGLVAEFVSMLTPRLNLAEYEMLLDVDHATVAQITHHLIYWRKAKIINVVNLQGVVTPRPGFDMRKLPQLSREWAMQFPTLVPLPSLLSTLSSPAPFRRVMPPETDRTVAFDALVWLLRQDLVVQLHVFVRIVAQPMIRRAAQRAAIAAQQTTPLTPGTASSGGDDYMGKTPDSLKAVDEDEREDRVSSVINEPSRPSQIERRWLEQITMGRPPTEVDHFERMMPFMNGRNHLDAIMMATSLTRREIRDVLDTFSSDLVTFLSPS